MCISLTHFCAAFLYPKLETFEPASGSNKAMEKCHLVKLKLKVSVNGIEFTTAVNHAAVIVFH